MSKNLGTFNINKFGGVREAAEALQESFPDATRVKWVVYEKNPSGNSSPRTLVEFSHDGSEDLSWSMAPGPAAFWRKSPSRARRSNITDIVMAWRNYHTAAIRNNPKVPGKILGTLVVLD